MPAEGEVLTVLTDVDTPSSTAVPSLSGAILAAVDALRGVCVVSTHTPHLVNTPKTPPLPDKKRVDSTPSTTVNSVNKRADVAHVGWFVLGGAIRETLHQRREVDRRIRLGKWVTRKVDLGRKGIKRIKERAPLDKEELAVAIAEYQELTAWLDQLQQERRQNAYLAGDLIPEIDRASAGEPLGDTPRLAMARGHGGEWDDDDVYAPAD